MPYSRGVPSFGFPHHPPVRARLTPAFAPRAGRTARSRTALRLAAWLAAQALIALAVYQLGATAGQVQGSAPQALSTPSRLP